MKKIKYWLSDMNKRIVHSFLILVCLIFSFSCNEKEFLREIPLDFASPENSYITNKDFEAAIYHLHGLTRSVLWYNTRVWYWWLGTDLVESYNDIDRAIDYRTYWGSTGAGPEYIWGSSYQVIYDANVILERSESDLCKLTADQKKVIQAEARFFRGYFHKILANLFGGVPIVLEETKTPKRDYVRATRQQVYEQCVEDLKYASANLPDINAVDESRLNKLAASHALAEVYISLGRWQEAITEATKVIDHPATALMTKRFGSTDEKLFNDPKFDGDVYWDMFRVGSQDRSNGNTESIWVLQFKYFVADPNNLLGGGDRQDLCLPRQVCPDLTNAKILQSKGTYVSVLAKANTYYNQRGQGYLKPSPYFLYKIWNGPDIRNAKHNIIRDYPVLNPSNEYNGKWVIADKLPLKKSVTTDTARFFFPQCGKLVNPGKDPAEYLDKDQSIPGSIITDARRLWRKNYQMRLAETYLLRAEAYLGAGNIPNATADINVVRRRANAPDATPGEINIDYILDERLRELHYEEIRIMTLCRLGKVVDRARRFCPVISRTIGDHQNLWAIPNADIIKNVEANLEQNPGY
jgi:hypothetical protein